MSEQVWDRVSRRALTRRAMLSWTGRAGVGAAGLALVGCGDDDDDDDDAEQAQNVAVEAQADAEQAQAEQDQAEQAEQQAEEQAEDDEEQAQAQAQAQVMPAAELVIDEVVLAGAEASALLTNVSGADISLEGWFFCKRPAYWAMPAALIPAGASMRVHMGEGADDAENIYANGGFTPLGSSGELAVYRNGSFDSPEAIVAYLGWGGGGGRAGVARSAGLWGDENVPAEAGQVLRRGNTGAFASSWTAMDAAVDESMASAPSGFGPIIIDRVYLDGHNMLQLRNISDAPANLDGHFMCQIPNYWPIPDGIELGPDETIFINTGAGTDTADTLFANGGMGVLGPANGEVAIYRSQVFDNPDIIQSYVGWNGGKNRLPVAQAAGIFGDPLDVAEGDVLVYDSFDGGAIYVKE